MLLDLEHQELRLMPLLHCRHHGPTRPVPVIACAAVREKLILSKLGPVED